MKTKLFTLRTRSGLHCGIGQGLSDIDLPTARDSVTGHPLVPGSSLKGVFRARFQHDGDPKFIAAFGPEAGSRENDSAAALSFGDARLVCLPVRSYFGTYACLASPTTLRMLQEQRAMAGITDSPGLPAYPADTDSYRASLPEDSLLAASGRLSGRVLLEELDLIVDENSRDLAGQWADCIAAMLFPEDREGRRVFRERFAIVDDNVLTFFCETALPVAAHNRIGENGVVADGALWYEEYVPPEAVFSGLVHAERPASLGFGAPELLSYVCGSSLVIQVGGNATTGRGLVSINFFDGAEG